MKTYITHSTFKECARALSHRDLRKARLNARDLLLSLESENDQEHDLPWSEMWRGHEGSLCTYGLFICVEWYERSGGGWEMYNSFERHRKLHVKFRRSIVFPWWLEDEKLHLSHRAALAFQDPDHYARLFTEVVPSSNCWWPPSIKPPVYTDPADEEEF